MAAPAALVLWETGRRTEPGLQAPWHIVAWCKDSHLGVPLIISDASVNVIGRSGDNLLAGFPGQRRVFADFYLGRYRDYVPVTGHHIPADPIGLYRFPTSRPPAIAASAF